MFSIETSQPSDPSFSPPLNTSSHELPEVVVADLPTNSPQFDHHNHTPLPNFSIRDYVFTARSKDIKKNWPFSLKNLQLCLKHGVKDVLPPFQSLDTSKNRSSEIPSVEITSLDKQNLNNFDKEPSKTGYYAVGETSGVSELKNKLAGSYLDVSSCRSGEENELPSTITSACQSEIEFPPDNRQSSSLLESDNLYKQPSVEVEAAGRRHVTNKSENISKPSGMKCKLIVKFGNNSDRSSSEDIASNCTSISESMASKVCPVCKTFSSSSNTTLNAHIDQCLYVESTPKWVADSKLNRHRIKPRKMRMMVDVYETAPHCTLDDLDRRNGTNWATVSSLPAQEAKRIEKSNDGKRPRLLPNRPDDAGADVGPVYIDATGTKVRILSKFDDQPPVVKLGEVNETGKGGKYIKKNKKEKLLVPKHQKHRDVKSKSKKNLSHKVDHATQVSTCQEGDNGDENSCEKESRMTKQAKPGDAETFRSWVCSKPRDLVKKIAYKERHQPIRCKWHLPQNIPVDSARSILNDSSSERAQRLANRSERNVDRPFNETRGNNDEQSPARKAAESHSLGRGTRDSVIVRRYFQQTKRKGNQLKKSGKFMRDRCSLGSPNSVANYVSSLRKKMGNTCGDATYISHITALANKKSARSSHAIVNKALKFSSFRRNILSASSQSSPVGSRCSNLKKWSTLKRSQVVLMTDRDKELQFWSSEVDRQGAVTHQQAVNQLELEETVDPLSLGGTNVRENIQERGSTCAYQREKAMNLKKAESTPFVYNPDEESQIDFGGDDFSFKKTQVPKEGVVTEPSSKTSEGSAKSVETGFCEMNYSSKANSNSIHSIENYGGFFGGVEASNDPAEPAFAGDPGMFSADELNNGMSRPNADIIMPFNSDDGHGSSFHVVDPIPIPGPPGSFLPSPRDMGSEDFHGNSSLTTSRVNSPPDQCDMIDGHSSDSPISAASTISNSTADRSDFTFLEPFSSAEPHSGQDKVELGLTATNTEVPIQNAISFPQTTVAGERTAFEEQFLKIDRISFDKGPLSYKNDQPCCCQRKERLSHGLFSNHEESQLLKRRKMAFATVSTAAKSVTSDLNPRGSMEFRPESTSPNSCHIPGSGKIILPTTKPTAICIPSNKDSPSGVARFATRSDCDSASPSGYNPILRLMGKDLLVVSKDEDVSVPLSLHEPRAQHNQQTSQVLSFSTASEVSPQNQDMNSFHHQASQGSAVFARDLHAAVGPYYVVGRSNSFRTQSDLRISQAHAQLPAGMFADLQTDRFAMSMEPNQYRGDFNFHARPNRLRSGTGGSSICNVDNVATTPGQHVGSSAHAMKEIIIIDDVPERESPAISDIARYAEGWRQHQVISSSGSTPVTLNRNQGCPHPLGESPIICNASFHPSPTMLTKSSPARWGCTSDGSVLLPRGPSTTAPSSSSHIRSTTGFYSPSIS